MSLMIPVSWGELIDKLTILQIKQERIEDQDKLVNVKRELGRLLQIRNAQTAVSAELDRLTDELRRVNETLWDIEDDIRGCERAGDFGPRFIELARSVYRTNDLRANLKFRINLLLGSELVEEKSYASY